MNERVAGELIRIAWLLLGKKTLTLYHGTSDVQAGKIKSKGLKNTTGSPKWYMLTSHKDDAIFHSETGSGKPVVVVFEIPIGDGERWDGFPYLWLPYKASGGFKGNWYAINEKLLPEFVKKVEKVSDKDLKRVKG